MSDYRPLILYFTQNSKDKDAEMEYYSGRRWPQRSTIFGLLHKGRPAPRGKASGVGGRTF